MYENRVARALLHSSTCSLVTLSVSCGPLDVSGTSTNNGENRVSTQKGSRLQYKCIDNAEVIVFECLSNGSWTPDPRVIKCSNISSFAKYVSSGGDFYTFILLCTHSDIIHCKAPVLPQNSHIDEERSIMGLMMVYQCNIGYKPTERTVSKCLATGEWAHNISDLQCIKQVDCGALMGLSNGFVDYAETMEGSVAILQCDKGLALLRDDLYVIKCNNNGTWMPNIFGQRCVDPLLKTGESCAGQSGNFYLIVGGTALLTSIPFGILVGWLLSKCRKRKQKNCQHSYEEVTPKRQQETIDIVQNEAYMKYQHNI
ncbi:Sushi, von Willebrand factor type A, EGF and pentraxin domain-containing protein 1 [Geodia barretti]|uniref:Sushi, von Willebrand factor type A, EGF and pentraxin domain-containing protein 1 n=2 Tax=Geodia barretti TaxID=519541 RepID=A0AA35W8Z0_GEOBA|nr:Sushi, von Willebrand factor type A, EGF and pentraxin domain-containing protein 1 [Geodia barretti]